MFAQELHSLVGFHVCQVVAQDEHPLERILVEQQIIPSRTGLSQIYSREEAFGGQVPVELEFHVTRTLEFFKDYAVHFRAGIYECGSQDGQ